MQHENASLGAQFSQAGNQLFDLQQSLQPYLTFLLRNQDQILLATQTNLAACQNELGYAMRTRVEPAKPMKNVNPEFKGKRRSAAARGSAGTAEASRASGNKAVPSVPKSPTSPAPPNPQTKKP